jgi:hypothetical protein
MEATTEEEVVRSQESATQLLRTCLPKIVDITVPAVAAAMKNGQRSVIGCIMKIRSKIPTASKPVNAPITGGRPKAISGRAFSKAYLTVKLPTIPTRNPGPPNQMMPPNADAPMARMASEDEK